MALQILRPYVLKQISNTNCIGQYFYVLGITPSGYSKDLAPTTSRQIHTLTQRLTNSYCKDGSVSNNLTVKISRQSSTDGIFSRIVKFIGLAIDSKAILRANSYRLYEAVADHVNYMEFFNKFELPNTFNSWFLVTELHVWMLLVRAMAENEKDAKFVRNCIIEAMWKDVVLRAKVIPSGRPKVVRDQIDMLNDQFQYSLVAYDEGLLTDDRTLSSAIWKRFFNANCDDYRQIELLIVYVRKNVSYLDALNTEDFLKKRSINWCNLTELEKEIF